MKKRNLSTYHAPSKFLSRKAISRKFHVFSMLSEDKKDKKDKKDACAKMKDICQQQAECVVTSCEKEKKKKKDVCEDRKMVKLQKKKEHKEEVCIEKCIPRGKCELPDTPKPPKMDYGPIDCPPPKYVKPKPCPDVPEAKFEYIPPCEDRVKKRKQVCMPPPIPKPPTKPVVLCPCPAPPKLPAGPCPCYDFKKQKPVKSKFPPCPKKEKYICPHEPMLCVFDPTCKRRPPCDINKLNKKKKK